MAKDKQGDRIKIVSDKVDSSSESQIFNKDGELKNPPVSGKGTKTAMNLGILDGD